MKNKAVFEKWGVRFSALYTGLVGIVNMTSAVQPALMNRLAIIDPIIPFEIRAGSRVTSALA